jgi:hypothetical protein
LKTFRDAIGTRDFVLTAELSLAPDSDADSIAESARILRSFADRLEETMAD